MSAPQIPNLLAGRGRGRGRGGARGGGGVLGRGGAINGGIGSLHQDASSRQNGPPPPINPHDRVIQRTDVDANDSRTSAVMLGYLNDEYAMHFNQNPVRRLPLINRGTYVRTEAIDTLVYCFLKELDGKSSQIISLGAGTDTRYWRLAEDPAHKDLIYHEIDYQDITINKMRLISQTPALASNAALQKLEPNSHGNFYSSQYNIHGLDVRRLPESIPNLRKDCPTLLISECCLCYLKPSEASAVIDYFVSAITTLGTIIYEPTNPNDPFGQMMKSNLAVRGLSMPTLAVYDSLEAQKQRLKRAGFVDVQQAADIEWLWRNWVEADEKERLDRIETLDEVEEWELLAKHYLIAWGFKDPNGTKAFDEWARLCPGYESRPG